MLTSDCLLRTDLDVGDCEGVWEALEQGLVVAATHRWGSREHTESNKGWKTAC